MFAVWVMPPMLLFRTMNKAEEQKQATGLLKLWQWIKEHTYMLLVFAGVILILCTLKTQTILITDAKNQEYTVELQYSMFGYCVSAVPMNEAAQPIAADHMFLLDSMDEGVGKAAGWIAEKTGGGVELYVSGYPRNNEKLLSHLIKALKQHGIDAVKLEER